MIKGNLKNAFIEVLYVEWYVFSQKIKKNSNCSVYSWIVCVYHLNTLKPLSHQTAMPQRLYSVLKPSQRAVGSPRNTPKISNLSVIACTQRHHSVHTTFPQRLYSVHDVFTARKQLLQRVHSAYTARSRRAHSVLTARTQRPHGDYSV